MTIEEIIESALKEDVGDGDHTSLATIDPGAMGTGTVKAKQEGVISGMEVATLVFKKTDPAISLTVLKKDGDQVKMGDELILAKGPIQSLLKAERLVLNCMQRMSGIATLTSKYVQAVAGTGAIILDTRKTTPNFRILEKYAVVSGGGKNHRTGLYDMILIKDNHVDGAGGITNAIQKANDYLKKTGKHLPIEIETRNLREVQEVLSIGQVQRIMLDNFTPAQIREALVLINGRFETEASGGITLENVRSYAETGVNFISVGALTHTFKSLDINMKIVKN